MTGRVHDRDSVCIRDRSIVDDRAQRRAMTKGFDANGPMSEPSCMCYGI
jgi:hypothetical protein